MIMIMSLVLKIGLNVASIKIPMDSRSLDLD